MAWKLAEVEDDPEALTDAELIGINVILANYMGEPQNEMNVYFRAYMKLNKAAERAIEKEAAQCG